MTVPAWASELITLYESGAAAQFLCYGNVNDRLLMPVAGGAQTLGSFTDFLLKVLLPRFDVVLSYDLGGGIRVLQGGEVFTQWPRFKEQPQLPRDPAAAVDLLGHYFRYIANRERLGRGRLQVACIVRSADLLAPAGVGGNDVNAIASQLRDWASDGLLSEHAIATFLVADNRNDLHPLVANNPRAASVKVPLPDAPTMAAALTALAPIYPTALRALAAEPTRPAAMLAGATLSAIEALLKTREYQRQPLNDEDLSALKKQLVEKDCAGLIDFIDPMAGGTRRTLDDLHGQDDLKRWLRQDLALWRANDLAALPMGYLLCGPVGTGKTFMVECLAGEAGVPVVKLKNFRDKWVGSTEGNLEKIFRLVHALGRAYVFIDEADQALGKRDGGSSDSGIGGRIYGMMAEEMSDTRNRGRIVWILASSRPDLIEVDLKRPGRVDVKIPLFPTGTPAESLRLLRALLKRRGLILADVESAALEPLLPIWLTPGAAEALAVKIYRTVKTDGLDVAAATRRCLDGYQPPVARAIMQFQIGLAVAEASDLAFVPAAFRAL